MTEAEINACVDELERRGKAAVADRWKKVWTFVTHNGVGLAIGGAGLVAWKLLF